MAITSTASHSKPYVQHREFDARLADVKKALASILQLDISLQMKKRLEPILKTRG
jgi:hypothetical protein